MKRGGGVRAGILTPIHHHPHHNTQTTIMLRQPQGHPGPNQQDTEASPRGVQAKSQLPGASFCPFPLYFSLLKPVISTNTHTLPWLLPKAAPVSLLTHSSWLHFTHPEPATHYLRAQGTTACPMLQDYNNTISHYNNNTTTKAKRVRHSYIWEMFYSNFAKSHYT